MFCGGFLSAACCWSAAQREAGAVFRNAFCSRHLLMQSQHASLHCRLHGSLRRGACLLQECSPIWGNDTRACSIRKKPIVSVARFSGAMLPRRVCRWPAFLIDPWRVASSLPDLNPRFRNIRSCRLRGFCTSRFVLLNASKPRSLSLSESASGYTLGFQVL